MMYLSYSAWACAISLFLNINTLTSAVVSVKKKIVNFEPSVITNEEVIEYFKHFLKTKVSSLNKDNEEFYTDDKYSEDLFHRIDNFMPTPVFLKLFVKTKNITDKNDGPGLQSNYRGELNANCDPSSVFNSTLPEILKKWDGNQILAINELEEWHKTNEKTSNTKLCNRFLGLTCQYKRALDPELDQGKTSEIADDPTCQCAGEAAAIGFYKSTLNRETSMAPPYPDGCYVRPWKRCKLLSRDLYFNNDYYEWHHNFDNERRTLAQIVFPVARIHRCKEGTSCVDMIPGMKKPICWCTVNSNDPSCKKTEAMDSKRKVPRGSTLDLIRRKFAKLIIPAKNSTATCNPEYNDKVKQLMKAAGKDPTRTRAIDIMEEMVNSRENIKICDLREALTCSEETRTCRGYLNCDPGKVHLGMGVCAVDNGFKCQTNEECVQNARCVKVAESESTMCVCTNGYYGNKCKLQKAAIFGSRFLPIVSGYEGDEYINLQIEINRALESWEDAMRRQLGESCDTSVDGPSMQLVEYFGSLERFDKQNGMNMVRRAQQLARESGGRMCQYKKFLRCDPVSGVCVPMHGNKIVSIEMGLAGKMDILVEAAPDTNCAAELPRVFEGVVSFVCTKGYFCKKHGRVATCKIDCNHNAFVSNKLCPTTTTTPEPEIDDQDKEGPETEGKDKGEPVTDGKDKEGPETDGKDKEGPETDGKDKEEPETDGKDKEEPETDDKDKEVDEVGAVTGTEQQVNTTTTEEPKPIEPLE
ncbi:unnamed protein product [Orchesella dallaii]|uniref:EGF-like domain-containing protein n=1 Tax=Orchesella dallaii TaxID=48710 RepID=A0ABP1R816_9HEXA